MTQQQQQHLANARRRGTLTSPVQQEQPGSAISAINQLTPSLGSAQVGVPQDDLMSSLATALGIDEVTLTSAVSGVLNLAHRRTAPVGGSPATVSELVPRDGVLAAGTFGLYAGVFADMVRERQRQDIRYGAPHDDRLEWLEWKAVLAKQLDKATTAWQNWDVVGIKQHLVHLAATSLAVMDAIDRDGTANALERSRLGA